MITPINKGKQSLVRHMLAIDWKYWKLYLRPSSARSITIRMLERLAGTGINVISNSTALRFLYSNVVVYPMPHRKVFFFAALRELFKSKSGSHACELLSEEVTSIGFLPPSAKEEINNEVQCPEEVKEMEEVASVGDNMERVVSGRKSLTEMNDAADEFFDAPEPPESCQLENEWSPEPSTGQKSPVFIGHEN